MNINTKSNTIPIFSKVQCTDKRSRCYFEMLPKEGRKFSKSKNIWPPFKAIRLRMLRTHTPLSTKILWTLFGLASNFTSGPRLPRTDDFFRTDLDFVLIQRKIYLAGTPMAILLHARENKSSHRLQGFYSHMSLKVTNAMTNST